MIHDFNGRTYKTTSLMAGKCSAYFLIHILDAIRGSEDEEELKHHIIKNAPAFDARIMEYPPDLLHEISNNIL